MLNYVWEEVRTSEDIPNWAIWKCWLECWLFVNIISYLRLEVRPSILIDYQDSIHAKWLLRCKNFQGGGGGGGGQGRI